MQAPATAPPDSAPRRRRDSISTSARQRLPAEEGRTVCRSEARSPRYPPRQRLRPYACPHETHRVDRLLRGLGGQLLRRGAANLSSCPVGCSVGRIRTPPEPEQALGSAKRSLSGFAIAWRPAALSDGQPTRILRTGTSIFLPVKVRGTLRHNIQLFAPFQSWKGQDALGQRSQLFAAMRKQSSHVGIPDQPSVKKQAEYPS
jgi:hypothetical protein